MQRLFKNAVLCALLVTGTAAQATSDSAKNCFNGYAYSENGATLLYTEHHEQTLANGRVTDWSVVYRSAGSEFFGAAPGKVIARKTFDFSANPTVPVYTLDLLAEGYREGVQHDAKGWRMIRRKNSNAKTETEAFDYQPPMAADSGFDPFVRKHFKALMAGKTVKFDFVAAGRLDVIGLRAYKVADTEFAGRPAAKFKAQLDSLLRLVVDSLEMTYDPETQNLLQYTGVSNLHNRAGDTFPVIIKYLAKAPAGAAQTNTPQGCTD